VEKYVRASDFLKVILTMKDPAVSPSMVRETIQDLLLNL